MTKIILQNVVQDSFNESIKVKIETLKFEDTIVNMAKMLVDSINNKGIIYFIGNGGSAADAQHIATELVGRFERDNMLPAVALSTDSSCLTALANDFGYDTVFSRQVKALLKPADTLVAISTSGMSRSINLACQEAKKIGAKVIGLSGKDGGQLKDLCNLCLVVPSQRTCRIQECHITVGHILCELIERREEFAD